MQRLIGFALLSLTPVLLTACAGAPEEGNACAAVQEVTAPLVAAPGRAVGVDWSSAFRPESPRTRSIQEDVVGVSLSYPDTWRVVPDPYRFETYGFVLTAEDPDPTDAHGGLPVARVALDYDAAPGDIEARVEAKRAEYPGVPMTRTEITVRGRPAVALGPVPGGQVSTNVYLAVEGRVYRINYYGESLDERGRALLEGLRFHTPRRSVASLRLVAANSEEALRAPALEGAPPLADDVQGSHASLEEQPLSDACEATETDVSALAAESQLPNGCWTQPTGFFIQTTHSWDANGDGWSQMGTPNFWGENTHGNWGLGKCVSDYYTNDFYAIDYFLDPGNRLYSPFAEGYVTYAGWDPENWWNYGNMVVIKGPNGKFWSLSAHMRAVNVVKGQYVTDATLIGHAGSTGYADPYPHVHQVFYRYASVSAGRPYGGQGVRQTALTYLGNGGGTYTNFSNGKWVSW